MGYTVYGDYKKEKHIENQDNKKTDNKIKHKTYEKIKDIVMGKNDDIPIGKNNIKNNKNNIKKPIIDIGL